MNTRRKFLKGTGAAIAAGLAGCIGGGGQTYETVNSLPRPAKGGENAPVTMLTFEDLQCPHCRTFTTQIEPQLIKNYVENGDLRIEWYDFPIPVGPQSRPAANAARAIQDAKGNEAFWTAIRTMFENQQQLSPGLYREIANELDIDGDMVVTKAKEKTYAPVITDDKNLGSQQYNIPGTPGIVINGELVEAFDYGTLSRKIEEKL